MSSFDRRHILKSAIAGSAAALLGSATLTSEAQSTPTPRKGRVHQSVSRWCYKDISLDDLCKASAAMGLKAIDLLQPSEFDTPARYGLVCSMGYVDAGTIPKALNRLENHDMIEANLRKNLPLAIKANVPNVITFSGNREGMSDAEGLKNTVIGLKRLKPIMEDSNVTLCMELLNSKHDHHDYMCDHTAWGVAVMEEVNSPHIKLLYDIYHMQIMEGDLIRTITDNAKWLAHFHTGGVPGRHELNDTQEVDWPGVMRGIVATGFTGYVAHEFVPTGDPLTSLRQAVDLCDV